MQQWTQQRNEWLSLITVSLSVIIAVSLCFIHSSSLSISRYTATGHGSLPQLAGNVNDVIISPLIQSCYQSSQALPQVYQHYGPSPIQPLSTEMQILLTVYYLVQLGQQSR